MDADILELDDARLVREMEQEIEESSESFSQLRICESSESVNNEERQLDVQDVSPAPPPPNSPRPMSEDGYITRSLTMSPDNEEYKLIRRARKRPRSSSFTTSPVKEECKLIRRAQKRPRSRSSSSDSSGSWYGVRHFRCRRRLDFTKERHATSEKNRQ
ncbi:hypothetical protein QAD02_022754 [Eretmocerus hayati]|uniref:Uncharacterized protein n=1 Tax=Eretmocerus hayati TaxID=131215 RepID=A0ACC2PU67_9HYME|nr:hypothetical protein QAD02_022754 [Eretmocerus hayati]